MTTSRCKKGQIRNPKTKKCMSKEKYAFLKQQKNLTASEIIIKPPSNSNVPCITKSKTKLKDYQKHVVQFLDTNRGIIVVHGTGSGKTLTAVTASQCFLKKNVGAKVIVCTPKSLIHNFRKEMETYGISANDPRYLFFTHDGLCNGIKSNLSNLEFFKNNMLIVDEMHNFRTQPLLRDDAEGHVHYSQSYFAILAAHASKQVLGLTATPIVNELSDLINPLSMITGKWIKSIPGNPNYDDLKAYKSLFSFYQRDETHPDFPKKVIHTQLIQMTNAYYEKYNRLEQFLKRHGESFTQTFHLSYRQAVNKLDNDWESPKVKWTVRLILNNLKTLVFSSFKDSGVIYIAAYLKAYKIGYKLISGENTINERKEIIDKFNSNKFRVLLITMAGGEGLDLKEVRQVVLFEPVWNPSTEEQIIGRAVRRNSHINLPVSERRVDVYKLMMVTPQGKETVDHQLTRIIDGKRDKIENANKIIKKLSIEMNHRFST